MKKCFKCGEEKSLSEFYKHKKMSDGYLNKCKICTKKDVSNHRTCNIEKIREYDRKRANEPNRLVAKINYTKNYRAKNLEKYKAHQAVNSALKSGKLKKQNCTICGTWEKLESHHEDYSKPLDIIWFCSEHHKARHKELKNNAA